MGMQSLSVQQPYSSAQQGKGQRSGITSPSFDQNAINADPQGFAQWQQGAAQQEQQHRGSTMYGKGSTTNSATSGQPQMGKANPYPNTVNPSDNTGMSQPMQFGGKSGGSAKGAR